MRTFILVFAAALAAFPQAQPQRKDAPRPQATRSREFDEGWVQAFNGKDLEGWIKVGNEEWTVENGAIHGKAVTKDYGYLMTDKKYIDLQMTLRFKCEGNGNSGVFIHTEFKPGTADVSQGMQFEIDPTWYHHTGGLYGDGRGWIAWPSPENELVVRKDDWNEYFLSVVGNHYRARLNGVWVMDFTDPSPRSFDGHIALQLHSGGAGNMLFKDIAIRDLSRR
jgi:hypothetical protein